MKIYKICFNTFSYGRMQIEIFIVYGSTTMTLESYFFSNSNTLWLLPIDTQICVPIYNDHVRYVTFFFFFC